MTAHLVVVHVRARNTLARECVRIYTYVINSAHSLDCEVVPLLNISTEYPIGPTTWTHAARVRLMDAWFSRNTV